MDLSEDILRKTIGKKDPALMNEAKRAFVEGCNRVLSEKNQGGGGDTGDATQNPGDAAKLVARTMQTDDGVYRDLDRYNRLQLWKRR